MRRFGNRAAVVLVVVAVVVAAGIALIDGSEPTAVRAVPGVPGFDPAVKRARDCDLVASPSAEGPATAQSLVDALRPGQTGCLRGGTYDEDDEIRIATPEIALAPYPGESATIRGRIWVARGADEVTVEGLRLDGRNERGLPSPTINAERVTFRANEVTNHHTAICVLVGDDTYGRADDAAIEHNRIHDCGRLPATNHDHGVYVAHAERAVIRGNWIYDNADRGVQMYPEARRTLVVSNVIDGNGQGVIFGGNRETASSGNVVRGNAITNSSLRHNVEANWAGPVGSGNVVARNCIHGGTRDDGDGGIMEPQTGFSATGNELVAPDYADREQGDFRIVSGGRCAELLRGSG